MKLKSNISKLENINNITKQTPKQLHKNTSCEKVLTLLIHKHTEKNTSTNLEPLVHIS